MKTLYLDMPAGVASDMLVGALLDLGADEEPIKKALAGFEEAGIAKVSYEIRRVNKDGIDACDFKVKVKEAAANYNRTLEDVTAIIDGIELSPMARRLVKRIFDIIAGAEGTVFQEDPNHLYFHETASIQKIADIVAFACCFDSLVIGDVYVSGVAEGVGRVKEGSKTFSIPVPEVKQIASFYNIPLLATEDAAGHELITPSGLAMLVSMTTRAYAPKKNYKIVEKGVGAGKLDFNLPAVLTVNVIEAI